MSAHGIGPVLAIVVSIYIASLGLFPQFHDSLGQILFGQNDSTRLSNILNAMLKIEEAHNVSDIRIAVGYGGCRDLFIPGSEILGKEAPPSQMKHHGELDSLDELKEEYAMFFNAGSAAERFISNKQLFQQLVNDAEKSPLSHYALGGNAPVMASRFAMEGALVLLAMNRNQKLLQDVPSAVRVAGLASTNNADDIHLIFEYEKGETWGPYMSPRANRFIVHSDTSNPLLEAADTFAEQMVQFQPHLLVVGGLQMMDNFPFKAGERTNKLKIVSQQMKSQSDSTRVHFELASFTELTLLKELKKFVIPFADSLGMNEQELPNLYNLLKYNNMSLVAEQNPRVAHVLDQMREIFTIVGESAGERTDGSRPLTRLHVHTLAFQAIMVDTRSAWKKTRAAATKAALVAHRHVCHRQKVKVKYSNLLMDKGFSLSTNPNTGRIFFDDLKPVSCWMETYYEICIAPVFVCTKVKQTAGGGDNISAAGLILQV